MTTPVTNQTPTSQTSASSTPSNGLAQLSNNFDTFLTLLTTQLKNQDPTAPMDSNQFTQQLVQFSQVEQQINTNGNLKTLITQGQNQIGTYATSYLGKSVSVTNGNAALSNGQADWSYALGAPALQTMLTVSDANGKVVYAGLGATDQGTNQFQWNGQDNNGNQLPDGPYTLTVTAKAADGSAIDSTISSKGVVKEIDMSSGTPKLVVGSMELGLNDIANVTN